MADNVVQVVIRAKDEASPSINKFQANMLTAATAITALNTSFLVVGQAIQVTSEAFRTLGKVMMDAASQAEEIKKLSGVMGMTAEETSRLKYAAEQSEVSIGNLSTAVRYLQRNMVDAAAGNEDLIAAFSRLGVSMDDIARGDTREVLLKMADGFRGVENAAERSRLSITLLGRSGTQVLPFFREGSAGIRQLESDSDKFANTISSRTVVALDQFGDAVSTASLAAEGLKRAVAEALAPAAQALAIDYALAAANLAKWVQGNRSYIEIAAHTVRVMVEQAASAIASAQANRLFGMSFTDLAMEAAKSLPVVGAFIKLLDGWVTKAAGQAKQQVELLAPFQIDTASLDNLKAAEQELGRLEAMQKQVAKALEQSQKTGGEVWFAGGPRTRRELELMNETVNISVTALRSFVSASSSAGIATDDLTNKVERQGKTLLQQAMDAMRYADSIREANRSMELIGQSKVNVANQKPWSPGPISGELPETKAPEFPVDAAQEWLDYMGLTNEAVGDLIIRLGTTNELVIGIAAGFEAFGQQGAIAFDLMANSADVMFRAAMDFVEGAGESFGKFFEGLFEGKSVIESLGDAFIALGNLVATVVRQIITELAAAVVQALVFKAVLKSVSMATMGGVPAMLSFLYPFSKGGSVKLAMGGSVPRTGEAAAAYPPLARGASGFTVPGAVQVFDKVPALLSPGEVVLPTVAGKSPADLLGELAGLSRMLKQEAAQTSAARQAAPNIINIQAFDLDALRGMLRHGDLAREQVRALDLGRA